MQSLSEQLSKLAEHAKRAEDAAAEARQEAHDELLARRAELRASAEAAVQQVDNELRSIGDSTAAHWNTLKAKVSGDLQGLKARMAEQKQELDARRAGKRADRLEDEAAFAIDYANASIEQAQLAVIDAIIGRLEAEEARDA
jgi:exoribonuclease R